MLVVVFFLVFILPLLLICLKQHYSFLVTKKSQQPPGPGTWQIITNLNVFRKQPHIAFKNLARVHGPLMSVSLGAQTVVVVSSSSMAQQFLRNHDHVFSGRSLPYVYYKIPKAAQSSITMAKECDETWKFLRGLSQESIFSSKSVESNAGVRKAKVQQMVKHLTREEGQVVDLEAVISATVYNIVSNAMVSRDIFDEVDDHRKSVKAVVAELIETVSVDFWSNKKGVELYGKIARVWEDKVKQRQRSFDTCKSIARLDLLDVLIENGFPDDQIPLVLIELLIAGTDSTVITVVWLMVELLRHPDILERVRDEVARAFQGDDDEQEVNETILTRSNYLQACIKETLRLHFPGPFLAPHRAIATCEIAGYVIPKDSMVIINAWAIARDQATWEDPTSFKPERFITSEISYKGTHFEYIPFSAGRRMCPGSKVAFKNIQLIVASFVHYFDWTLPNGNDASDIDVSDKFNVHLTKDKPVYLMVRRRISRNTE